MSINQIINIIPVIKVNNRNVNQTFYVKTLGMKTLLEEGAFISLGDQTLTEKIILEESPSMRTRRVNGTKKLSKLLIKVQKPEEIEALLAENPDVDKLYQGPKGYAFETTSPEGDCVFLYADDDLSDLKELIEVPCFKKIDNFSGISQFAVSKVEINVPDVLKAEQFYANISNTLDFLAFQKANGTDLQVDSDATWDVTSLKFQVSLLDIDHLHTIFSGRNVFVPKSNTFFLSKDDSNIELWFEA